MRTLDDEELRAFLLAGTRTAKVGVVRRDGSPLVTPVWFLPDEDGSIMFETSRKSVKGFALRRDPRVSICVEDDDPPFGFVRIDGVAELSDDLDELRAWTTRIAARYMGEDRAEEFGRRNAVPERDARARAAEPGRRPGRSGRLISRPARAASAGPAAEGSIGEVVRALSSLRLGISLALSAGLLALAPGAQAHVAAVPTLYVNFFGNQTIAVTLADGTPVGSTTGSSPTVIPAGYYALVFSGPGGCSALPNFKLSGPGTSIVTSMSEGAVLKAIQSANFTPTSTYTWVDDAFPNVVHTFSTSSEIVSRAASGDHDDDLEPAEREGSDLDRISSDPTSSRSAGRCRAA